jgi:hypothetical protein
MRRRELAAQAFAGSVLIAVWLQGLQLILAHRRFGEYGPVFAIGIVICALLAYPTRRCGGLRRAAAAVVLTAVVIAPEWVESELTRGDGIGVQVLLDHGAATLATFAAAGVAAAALLAGTLRRRRGA